MNECCGTCKWHQHEDIDDGWVCVNDRSEYCTDWTDYKDCCEDWEGKDGKDKKLHEDVYKAIDMAIEAMKEEK